MEVKSDILWRVYLSFLGVVALSLLILGRAAYIQRFEGAYWRSLSDSLHQKIVELDADRGTIYSEDGQMLSTSIPFFNIYMDLGADGLREKGGRRFREHLDSFSTALSEFFGDRSPESWKRSLQSAYNDKNRYFLIRKGLSFDEYRDFRALPLVRLGRNKSGVIAEVKSRRLNPFGLLARRTIGLSRDNAQNVGLERTYDSLLQGAKGKRLVRYIAGGAAMPVEGYEIEPENGRDIITTIDVTIQDITENALHRMLAQHEAQYGTAIVMETGTGKIKAIANLGRQKDGSYTENYNYALQANEPGSTVKLATLLAVLDKGSSRINDQVHVGTAGRAKVGKRMVTDAERSPKAVMSVRECFAHSSNVAMAQLALKAFGDDLGEYREYLKRYRLDRRTGIDLLGEDRPALPDLRPSYGGQVNMLTAAFGYAIKVSPLQTLTLYNAVANGGRMVKPHLVSAIRHNGVLVRSIEPEVLEASIASESVIRDARSAMEAVVTEGTAKAVFEGCPFPVAGKTGTSHVVQGRGYGGGVYQASFAGYFPADNPKYAMIVLVRTKPYAAIHYGGQLAAPVFKEVAMKLHALYIRGGQQVPRPAATDSTAVRFAQYKRRVKGTEGAATRLMPDVRQLALKDAVYVLENRNLKVQVRGRGKVVAQTVLPGAPVNPNQTVMLLLN